MTQDIEKYIAEFRDEHAFYTSTEEYCRAVDWLRAALTTYGNDRFEEGVKAERERIVEFVRTNKYEHISKSDLLTHLQSDK